MKATSDQIRAARALVNLQQSDLARRAGVSVVTIRRLEHVGGYGGVGAATAGEVCLALEEAGVEFIPGGVRRRRNANLDEKTLFDDLRAISLRSARGLTGRDPLTEDDLYDEEGLPG